ncbi:gustatory receptor 9 isoform X2 [Bombyx mori]|uniref:gustatory receptor 9 isoform X2 n=1 Tax=Bombyx mori TaxID=7091 RepID=UPI000640B67C
MTMDLNVITATKCDEFTRIYYKELCCLEATKIDQLPREMPPSPDLRADEPKTPCLVGGAHAFILKISSFCGLAPLRFEPRSQEYAVTISKGKCFYSYILVTFLVICTIYGLVAEIGVGVEKSVRMSSRMSQVVSACDILVVAVTAGVGVYGAPARMRTMLSYMENIVAVDRELGRHHSAATERKLCALLLLILLSFTILLVDDFCFYAMQAGKTGRQWEIVTNYAGFYFLWYIVMVLELQFAFTALSLRARLKLFNEALNVTASQVCKPVKKPKNSQLSVYATSVRPVSCKRENVIVETIRVRDKDDAFVMMKTADGVPCLQVPPCEAVGRLSRMRCTLCEVTRHIADGYGLPLVIILMSTLLHLIVTPYFLIMEIIVSTHRLHFLVLQFLWCTTHLIRMLVVVEPCHYTIREGKRTEDILCRLMTLAPHGGVLSSRLEVLSRLLMLQNISYSPLGMCTLDRPLMVTVLGAVTTYLVILIQFQRYDS